MKRIHAFSVLLLATVFVILVARPAYAISCGDEIRTSVKLTANLGPCPGNGLTIINQNDSVPITINLNGHSITGSGVGIGLNVLAVGNILVKGPGEVSNFSTGLSVILADNVMFASIDVKNNATGAFLSQGSGLRIYNSFFYGGSVGVTGVSISETSKTYVYRSSIRGFSDFGVWVSLTNAEITQNTILGNGKGVFVRADHQQIRGNTIRDNLGEGIEITFGLDPGTVLVSDNRIQSNSNNGILVGGSASVHDSVIQNNIVRSNHLNGISVAGAANTVVAGNILSGNENDLQWDGVSSACWKQNIYKTSIPASLPACP